MDPEKGAKAGTDGPISASLLSIPPEPECGAGPKLNIKKSLRRILEEGGDVEGVGLIFDPPIGAFDIVTGVFYSVKTNAFEAKQTNFLHFSHFRPKLIR